MAKKTAAPRASHTLSDQFREVIASRMATSRGSKGMTLAELGQDAKVDPTVIGRFLSGERDLRLATADKIAAALGLRLVEIARPEGKAKGKAKV